MDKEEQPWPEEYYFMPRRALEKYQRKGGDKKE